MARRRDELSERSWPGYAHKLRMGELPSHRDFIAAFHHRYGRGGTVKVTGPKRGVSSRADAFAKFRQKIRGRYDAEQWWRLLSHLVDQCVKRGFWFGGQEGYFVWRSLRELGFDWLPSDALYWDKAEFAESGEYPDDDDWEMDSDESAD